MIACQMTEAIIARHLEVRGRQSARVPLEVKGQRLVFPGVLKSLHRGLWKSWCRSWKEGWDPTESWDGQSLGLRGYSRDISPNPRLATLRQVLSKNWKQKELAGLPHMLRLFPRFKIVNMPKEEKIKGSGQQIRWGRYGLLSKSPHWHREFEFHRTNWGRLDEIANGRRDWVSMMTEFYQPFHDNIAQNRSYPLTKEKFWGLTHKPAVRSV